MINLDNKNPLTVIRSPKKPPLAARSEVEQEAIRGSMAFFKILKRIDEIEKRKTERKLERILAGRKRAAKQQLQKKTKKLLTRIIITLVGISTCSMFSLGVARSTQPIAGVMSKCKSIENAKGFKESGAYVIGMAGEPSYQAYKKLTETVVRAKRKITSMLDAHLFGTNNEKTKKAINTDENLRNIFNMDD